MSIFYIDFESWRIEADTEDNAIKKAEDHIDKGHVPSICGTDDSAEADEGEFYGSDQITLKVLSLDKFKGDLKNGLCPFCGKKLQYYDGCLGYEALRCYDCDFATDHNGMHLEKLR